MAGGVLETPSGETRLSRLSSVEMLQLYVVFLALKLFLPDCVIVRECGILGNIWIRLEPSVLADVCQGDA